MGKVVGEFQCEMLNKEDRKVRPTLDKVVVWMIVGEEEFLNIYLHLQLKIYYMMHYFSELKRTVMGS